MSRQNMNEEVVFSYPENRGRYYILTEGTACPSAFFRYKHGSGIIVLDRPF